MAENAHRVCQRSVHCRLHSHEGRQQNALVPRVRQTTSRSDSAMTRRRQAEEGADSPTAGGQMRDISPMASCHLSAQVGHVPVRRQGKVKRRFNAIGDFIFSQRATTRLASFNTRTLTAQWKQNELMAYLEQQWIALCAIQEHRIVHKEEVRDLQLAGGWRLVTSSADAAGVGGVGFALSPKASKTLSRSIAVSPQNTLAPIHRSSVSQLESSQESSQVSQDTCYQCI